MESKLSNAQIIDPKLLDADGRCVFGATVELEDLDTGDTVTYQIVGDDEADIKEGKIAISSPIARALIGKFAGDVAEVQAPGGVRELELIDVRYAGRGRHAALCRAPLPHLDHPVGGSPVGDRASGGADPLPGARGQGLAGRLAGDMFTYVAWLGMALAAYLLIFVALRKEGAAFKSSVFWLVLVMLLLTVAGYFGVQPILAQLKADSFLAR